MSLIDVQSQLLTIDQAADTWAESPHGRTQDRGGRDPAFQLDGRRTAIRIDEHGLGGFVQDVSVPDMLAALRDELTNLEFDALRGSIRESGHRRAFRR